MDSSGSIVKDPPAAAQQCESWAERGQPGRLNIPDAHTRSHTCSGVAADNGVLHFICVRWNVDGGSDSTSRVSDIVFISGKKEDG